MSSRFLCFFFLRNSMSSFTSLVVLALVFLLDNMVVNWNIQVSWILESLLKVQLLYFWYESFLAIEVCTQGTWSYWMKSVACCDKSLLIGRNALRSCEKPFRCSDWLSECFKRYVNNNSISTYSSINNNSISTIFSLDSKLWICNIGNIKESI